MEVNDALELDSDGKKPNFSGFREKGKKQIGFLNTRYFPPNFILLSRLAIRTKSLSTPRPHHFFTKEINGLLPCKNFCKTEGQLFNRGAVT